MELSYEEYRQVKKDLRRRFSVVGWILLIYYAIMNVSVLVTTFAEMIISMMSSLAAGDIAMAVENTTQSAWGYFLAVAIGLIVLLVWKKPAFWKTEIWARGKTMKPGSFLALLSLFLCGQLVYQIVMIGVEAILNVFGYSVLAGMEAVSMDTSDFGMFLYGGILAPITEELLFRGLVQRTLQPYGRRFAILASAFTFGIFHGNLLQAPYAFAVGLVLGYVASEYSIGWAMVLHMINNLVLGDMFQRLTAGMNEIAAGLLFWAILLASALGGLIALIRHGAEIREYRRENPIHRLYSGCFFSSPGVIVLMVVMGLSMVLSIFVMVLPL